VAGVAVGSRNTRFQATRYGLTWAGLAPADRASFLGAFLHPGYACSIRGLPVVTFSGISGSIDAGQ